MVPSTLVAIVNREIKRGDGLRIIGVRNIARKIPESAIVFVSASFCRFLARLDAGVDGIVAGRVRQDPVIKSAKRKRRLGVDTSLDYRDVSIDDCRITRTNDHVLLAYLALAISPIVFETVANFVKLLAAETLELFVGAAAIVMNMDFEGFLMLGKQAAIDPCDLTRHGAFGKARANIFLTRHHRIVPIGQSASGKIQEGNEQNQAHFDGV